VASGRGWQQCWIVFDILPLSSKPTRLETRLRAEFFSTSKCELVKGGPWLWHTRCVT
jgi:hypothetical protein